MSDTHPSRRRARRRRPGGPRRWTAADKAAYLAAFATSRQTIKVFCAETGVPRATFNLWQREARDARGGRAAPRRADAPAFARVELGPPSAWGERGPGKRAMIGLASGRPIFLATGVTDLRRGVSGLYAIILDQLRGEPLSGAVYAFCNRRRDSVKLFCYDTGGVWICAKRLEQGTFRWPAAGARTCS